jgi:hypothetical protein
MSLEVEHEIIHCYTVLGWGINRIARYLNRAASYIHNVLRRHNIPTRPRGRPRRVNPLLVRELYRQTGNISATAKLVGCDRSTVHYHLRDAR